MANEEQLEFLRQGAQVWNSWRDQHLKVIISGGGGPVYSKPDLSGAKLRGLDLSDANLSYARLTNADLEGTDLTQANFINAVLSGANLSSARLVTSNFISANLNNANLTYSQIIKTNLSYTDLTGADLSKALMVGAIFSGVDLREVKGLGSVRHAGSSEISINTIYESEGKIPEEFLLGCGVHESSIAQIPALVAAMQPIQFYSCFISYSGRDEEFARRLHSRMRQADLRVWFAPEDMKGGDKLYDQIDRAIQIHDRLLLVLSESSLKSKWVETEIRRARKVELREGRRKLFPIRLVSYEALQEWTCINSTTGEDLAEEVRSYFIPDFSNWKSHDDFEQAFGRLLADLKASA